MAGLVGKECRHNSSFGVVRMGYCYVVLFLISLVDGAHLLVGQAKDSVACWIQINVCMLYSEKDFSFDKNDFLIMGRKFFTWMIVLLLHINICGV